MTPADLLADAFGRIPDTVDGVLAGIDEDVLVRLPDPEGNSIAWLVWHLIRVQDDHVSEVAGREQAWTADGWADRFALPLADAATATGYGHGPAEVAAVRPGADLLRGYLAAVNERTQQFLRTLTPEDLDRVVDVRWDPPVTLGVRLVIVVDDDAQHAGQAALLRGVLERGRPAQS
ncbi:DinB family protein [Pseudonocardia benzenivorans]|uniref:DinB family protein n=1 Tax=Pseudonocardia benzenivorans TaxID=228005 RepID=A0ABW3VMQ8_9PSEU